MSDRFKDLKYNELSCNKRRLTARYWYDNSFSYTLEDACFMLSACLAKHKFRVGMYQFADRLTTSNPWQGSDLS